MSLRSFLRGMAHVLDIGGTLGPDYPIARTPEEAARLDAAAISADWRAVGDDLRYAIRETEADSDQPTPPESE